MMQSLYLNPMGAVRQTRRDKFNPSSAVIRYRAYRDMLRLHIRQLPDTPCFIFVLPMPASWPKKKRDFMRGKPHTQVPDIDNLIKGVMDAVLKNDGHIHQVMAAKFWGDRGQIFVQTINLLLVNPTLTYP